MSGRVRLALTAAVALALAGCAGTAPSAESAPTAAATTGTSAAAPSSSVGPPPAAGQRIEVQVAGGAVTGDTGRVPVPVGEPVTLSVTADVADEIHVHGYDLTAPVGPGTPAEVTFDADIAGVFEVELHDAGTVLLTLQVG